jgi:hypothetical protein
MKLSVLPNGGRLLQPGNTKLGPNVWTYSQPQVDTCPGRSQLCEKVCYAHRPARMYKGVAGGWQARLDAYTQYPTHWVKQMMDELWQLPASSVVRLHVSGDFHTRQYAEDWYFLMQRRASTRFWVITRSWVIPEIRETLIWMSARRNVAMWWSVDETLDTEDLGVEVPPTVKLAYMQSGPDDGPGHLTDDCGVVFRVSHGRRTDVQYKVDGVLVCPIENGDPRGKNLTCSTCKWCYSTAGSKS